MSKFEQTASRITNVVALAAFSILGTWVAGVGLWHAIAS